MFDSQERSFLVLLCASALGLTLVLSPFLYVFALAAVTASVLWPVHVRLVAKLGGRRWASAVVLMAAFTLIFGVPLAFLGSYLVNEGARGVEGLFWELSDSDGSWLMGLEYGYELARERAPADLLPPAQEIRDEVVDVLRTGLVDATRVASAGVSGLLSALWRLLVDLTAFAVSLYVAFTRGPELLHGLRRVAPLRDRYVSRLYEVFQQLAMNIVLGMVGTGIVQGFAAGVGFALAGVPAAVILGAATAAGSLVPVVGSFVIWGPVVGGLVASGRVGAALFVVIWSLAVTASADNIVKPFLLKSGLQASPLWMVLALFGGLLTMGVQGLVFGPLLLVLYLTLYTIYLRDFVGEEDLAEAVGLEDGGG